MNECSGPSNTVPACCICIWRPFQKLGTAFASVSAGSALHNNRYHESLWLIQLVPPLICSGIPIKQFTFTLISCVWRLILAGHVLKRVWGSDVRELHSQWEVDWPSDPRLVRGGTDVWHPDAAREMGGPRGAVQHDLRVPPNLLCVHQAEWEFGPIPALPRHPIPHQQEALAQALRAPKCDPARHNDLPHAIPGTNPATWRRPPPLLHQTLTHRPKFACTTPSYQSG